MKKSFFSAAAWLFLGSLLVNAEDPQTLPPPPKEEAPAALQKTPPPPRKESRDPRARRELTSAIWRAYAGLSEKERAELLKLQREDWEAYRKKIDALGEKVLAAEKQRRTELAGWVSRYRDPATPDKEKAELKVRIQEALRAEYVERIKENRHRIEEMKRRTAQMEKELNRRSAETEKAVAMRLDYVLKSGDLDLPPPPRSRHGGPRRMPPPKKQQPQQQQQTLQK